MGKVIIAIHGLGNKPPKEQLETWGRMAIEEGLKNMDIKLKLPKFELVYWADILYDKPQTIYEKDKESPYYLDEPYTLQPRHFKIESHNLRHKFVDYLRTLINKIFLKENYELRYAFVSQKLLHNYFNELEIYFTKKCDKTVSINCEEKKAIINRLANVLRKYKNDEILLIAHSMGTIIAFDVLSFIAEETGIHTFVTMGSPLGLPFVISRIARKSRKKNHGHLKLQTPESVYRHWYNFSDIQDKIALDYKLAEDFKANSKEVKVIDKLVINTYVMNGVANPHKSFGYLRTPEFIRTLSDFIKDK
jgi:hypothetical protein